MPTNKVEFKERSLRRLIRAARKEGLVARSTSFAPDGTIVFSFASLPQRELPDTSEINQAVENEWDKHIKEKGPK